MDGRDHGVDRIEADIQVGNVEEAASEKRAERKQHHGEHDLQRNETIAQIPASGRWFDGADGGADQQHDARGKKRVEEEAVVALEMELEGNVVGRGPAQISEAAAQQRVEREPCGGAQATRTSASPSSGRASCQRLAPSAWRIVISR